MFKTRLEKMRQQLSASKIDAVLISSQNNITYLSGYSNFSNEEREAYIFVGDDFAYLITDARYTHEAKTQIPHLEIFERSHSNPTENLFKKHKVNILGIEENNLTVSEYKFIKRHFKSTRRFEISRCIKTEDEIRKIEEACKIGDLAFEHILKKFKVEVTEKEIAEELENFIRSKKAILSFPSIVAFGKNSAIPHHHTGDDKLKSGQIVLLDFGVKFENYCSDMTRTVFFGRPSLKQKKMYEEVLKAQQKAVDVINSGERRCSEIFKVSLPNLPHSLGHGIGLEVHETPHISPKSKEVLKEGIVFSIEPGIYIEGYGGVRVEDLFVLEKKGLKKLTSASIEPKII